MIFRGISKRIPFLIGADLCVIVTICLFQSFLRFGRLDLWVLHSPFLHLSAVIFPSLFYIFDLYYPYKYFKPGITFFEVALSVCLGSMILAGISYLDRSFTLPRAIFFTIMTMMVPFIFGVRLLYDALFRTRFLDKNVLIVGSGPLAHEMIAVIQGTAHSGMRVVGIISERELPAGTEMDGVPVVGTVDRLLSVMDFQGAQLVVLALEKGRETSELQMAADLLKRSTSVTSALHLLEKLTGKIPDPLLEGHTILGLIADLRTKPYLKLKRLLDVGVSLVLCVIFLPIFVMAVCLLAFSGPGKVFFVQERIGKDSRPFKLIKLRSMMALKDGQMAVTRLGRWLRKYRIDEMPQIVNVLKGDMSLVGPRPEVSFFVERSLAKIPFYETVFMLRPGLTGWAQVKFRYTTTVKDYHEKFSYNLYYLKHISFVTDVLILMKTVRIILFGLGE